MVFQTLCTIMRHKHWNMKRGKKLLYLVLIKNIHILNWGGDSVQRYSAHTHPSESKENMIVPSPVKLFEEIFEKFRHPQPLPSDLTQFNVWLNLLTLQSFSKWHFRRIFRHFCDGKNKNISEKQETGLHKVLTWRSNNFYVIRWSSRHAAGELGQ